MEPTNVQILVHKLEDAISRNRTRVSQNHFPVVAIPHICKHRSGKIINKVRQIVCTFGMIKQQRSELSIELQTCNWDDDWTYPENESAGEVCVYMPKTREQFRIAGKITKCSKEVVEGCWEAANADEGCRRQFMLLFPTKLQTEPRSRSNVPMLEQMIDKKHFCVLHLQVDYVDHLLLGKNQERCLWYISDTNEWKCQRVNP
eukprot:TRINITY_DN8940_c0_g2_i1.p2 TRINITY_DN8940_c0_g2~~TRINITY_DN8940_c0_g2_i1.p2  ORF type:complete len:202 (+),score=16.41 TRINITY_DN8940_c0_g2_i1:170-775(+)